MISVIPSDDIHVKSKVIKIRVSDKDLLNLDSICEITKENRSEAIRKAIDERRKRILMEHK